MIILVNPSQKPFQAMIIFICRKLCVKQTRIQVFSDSYFPVNLSSYFTQRIGWHAPNYNYTFFISNTFISNTRLKLAKNQAKAKQHSETELSKIIHFHYSRYHLKIIDILKNVQKTSALILITLIIHEYLFLALHGRLNII